MSVVPSLSFPDASPRSAGSSARTRGGIALRGEPRVWLCAGGMALALMMILCLLVVILLNGLLTFWPAPLVRLTLADGRVLLGQVTRVERFRPASGSAEAPAPEPASPAHGDRDWPTRRLVRTANYDLYGSDFQWVADSEIAATSFPADARLIERQQWGPFIGKLVEFRDGGRTLGTDTLEVDALLARHEPAVRKARREVMRLERVELGRVNHELEQLRLQRRARELAGEAVDFKAREAELHAEHERLSAALAAARAEAGRYELIAEDAGGRRQTLAAQDIVRVVAPNGLSFSGALGVYLSRWWEFLSGSPREANTEGGLFPAIFGTVLMTLLMSVVVGPFGVIAAIYLREYARQGALVSTVRVAVSNLAGVPSIVYGIFGLGFFCYMVGGLVDELWFPERLPAPTFGTPGILWSSLTLALLTLPVVIVATEEALAAVPKSMREGSYACGASKWQTIRRIVLPKALPGIMTGLILAMARGAGEVAPLMITGAVKLAPELPLDVNAPFLHLERSFMHLGFHIYDVGFQSRNSEAAKPMVYTTTLLLIAIVAGLNVFAMFIRARMRRKFKDSQI